MDALVAAVSSIGLFAAFIEAVPPEACFANFRGEDCGGAPQPVMYYWKPGSRCEVGIWRGCLPSLNMFKDEYECVSTCIFAVRAQPPDFHQALGFEEYDSTTVEATTDKSEDEIADTIVDTGNSTGTGDGDGSVSGGTTIRSSGTGDDSTDSGGTPASAAPDGSTATGEIDTTTSGGGGTGASGATTESGVTTAGETTTPSSN